MPRPTSIAQRLEVTGQAAAAPEVDAPETGALDVGAGPAASTDGERAVDDEPATRSTATASQLRRFIKSRPYVPLHELRRRFAIAGSEDEVVSFELDGRRLFVGLPTGEGRLLADLLRQGEIGCELSLDPDSPIVVGVFPMRPVARA